MTRKEESGDLYFTNIPEVVINSEHDIDRGGANVGVTLICVMHEGKRYGLGPVMFVLAGKRIPAIGVEAGDEHRLVLPHEAVPTLEKLGLPHNEAEDLMVEFMLEIAKSAVASLLDEKPGAPVGVTKH